MREKSSKVKDFINEVIELCKKYKFSISHEDIHGAFLICNYDEKNIDWFRHAFDKTIK